MEIAAGEFKAKCLRLMDHVQQSGEEIIITKHGKPVAKLVPVDNVGPQKSLYGYMKGTAETFGDIVEPIDEIWNAEK